MPMKLGDAQDLVYNIVVPWVAQQALIVPPNVVDTSRTFPDPPPKGYYISQGNFDDLCQKVIAAAASKKITLTLSLSWKQDQFNNSTIDDFNGQTAALVVAASASPTV